MPAHAVPRAGTQPQVAQGSCFAISTVSGRSPTPGGSRIGVYVSGGQAQV